MLDWFTTLEETITVDLGYIHESRRKYIFVIIY